MANTKYQTSFTVMPVHTNWHYPLIFGGAFFSQLDLCAANTVRRFLYASQTCEAAVTHKAEVSFCKPTYAGDLINLTGEVVSAGKKSVVVTVRAYRENHQKQEPDFVAEAQFVFVSVHNLNEIASKPDLLPYAEHGVKL